MSYELIKRVRKNFANKIMEKYKSGNIRTISDLLREYDVGRGIYKSKTDTGRFIEIKEE